MNMSMHNGAECSKMSVSGRLWPAQRGGGENEVTLSIR